MKSRPFAPRSSTLRPGLAGRKTHRPPANRRVGGQMCAISGGETPEIRRIVPIMTSNQPNTGAFTCVGCGSGFEANPRVARALARSDGDPETAHLCWVCTRLHVSAIREVARDVGQIEAAVAVAFR